MDLSEHSTLRPPNKDCLPFSFTATTTGYYRLWLVNMVLTVLTLGIYSAWAKVRTQKYLLGHTHFAGGRFDYHGKPWAILKGRLIMLAALLAWGLSESMPLLHGLIALLAVIAAPWLTVQAMRFRLANTSWNQMHFRFDGKPARAYLTYAKSWLLLLFTLGLAWPWATLVKRRFLLQHSALGQARLAQQNCAGRLYLAALGGIFGALLYGIVLLLLGWLLQQGVTSSGLADSIRQQWGNHGLQTLFSLLSSAVGMAWLLASAGFWRALMTRALLNHTALMLNGQSQRIEWWISSRILLGLHFSNALALLLSLGLAWPWVRVRTLRAQFSQLALFSQQDLAQLQTSLHELDDARGDELADLLELDLGW